MIIPKYKQHDIVKILKGHIIWQRLNGRVFTKDIQSELIGELAKICKKTITQNQVKYSLRLLNNSKYIAWFNEKDLELIKSYDTSTNKK